MVQITKAELVKAVNMAAREYGVSTVLFRHAVGETLGVNVTDMECLALIFFNGLATPSEISRHTGLTSGATTAMLDRLERAHLIERRPNPDDRRGSLVVIKDERNHELDRLFSPVREAVSRLNASYSGTELEIIADYLEKLVVVWEKQRLKLNEQLAAKGEAKT